MEFGVMALPTGALGAGSEPLALGWVNKRAPAMTTTAATMATIVYSMSGLPDPPEPRVPARFRARFASRLRRRCGRAERRVVGGWALPAVERSPGALDVIAFSLVCLWLVGENSVE